MEDEEAMKKGFRWKIQTKDPLYVDTLFCKQPPFLNKNRVLVLDYRTFIPIENVSSWESLMAKEL